MTTLNSQLYADYLTEYVLSPYYTMRLHKLSAMRLFKLLKRKNPYLFKAKNFELATDLVKSLVDAFLSSQEETDFGNLMEGFAIYVSSLTDGGFKSALKSVDLEFRRGDKYYIVGIKSGTNWGNSDQVQAMRRNFGLAKDELRKQGQTGEIIAVNGCMYGTENVPLKLANDPEEKYYKMAGQDFWLLISGDNQLYRDMIVPIDKEAKKKDDQFKAAYAAKINEMSAEFMQHFMTPENQIDWFRLVDHVSQRRDDQRR